MIVRIRTIAVCTVLGAALFACDSSDRQDAQVVLSAIHRYRSAPNDALPAMVDALRGTPCKAADTCEAKARCLTVGDATSKALRLTNEVELGMSALERGALPKDSPEAQSFPKKLDDASALLKQGNEGLPHCDAAVQALKRKYGI